jgi:hypothetical protein
MDLTNASAILTARYEVWLCDRRLAHNTLHRTFAATAKQVCATGTLRPCSSPCQRRSPRPWLRADRVLEGVREDPARLPRRGSAPRVEQIEGVEARDQPEDVRSPPRRYTGL